MSERRPTVAVDFDGVLHQYAGDWKGHHVIEGEPVEGALEWLCTMVQSFDVAIHSTRCNTWRGRRAIRRWLRGMDGAVYNEHRPDQWHRVVAWGSTDQRAGLDRVIVRKGKPPAWVYIDDRAWRYLGPGWMGSGSLFADGGLLPTKDQLHRLRPWWRP